jgi:soluble lytic murein transglycosylase-like protein
MDTKQLAECLLETASLHGVNPHLVCAIATVESSRDPLAVRYEPKYAYLVSPAGHAARLGITAATETVLQRFSYGAMQIMGANLREQGFLGSLVELFANPELAIEGAVVHLVGIFKRLGLDPMLWSDDVVASYNAGSARKMPYGGYSNQVYVDRVKRAYKELE